MAGRAAEVKRQCGESTPGALGAFRDPLSPATQPPLRGHTEPRCSSPLLEAKGSHRVVALGSTWKSEKAAEEVKRQRRRVPAYRVVCESTNRRTPRRDQQPPCREDGHAADLGRQPRDHSLLSGDQPHIRQHEHEVVGPLHHAERRLVEEIGRSPRLVRRQAARVLEVEHPPRSRSPLHLRPKVVDQPLDERAERRVRRGGRDHRYDGRVDLERPAARARCRGDFVLRFHPRSAFRVPGLARKLGSALRAGRSPCLSARTCTPSDRC